MDRTLLATYHARGAGIAPAPLGLVTGLTPLAGLLSAPPDDGDVGGGETPAADAEEAEAPMRGGEAGDLHRDRVEVVPAPDAVTGPRGEDDGQRLGLPGTQRPEVPRRSVAADAAARVPPGVSAVQRAQLRRQVDLRGHVRRRDPAHVGDRQRAAALPAGEHL